MEIKSVSVNEFDEALMAAKTYMPIKSPAPTTSYDVNSIYSGIFTKGLESGESPFLPKDGVIALKPAYNLYNNELHKNLAQVQFQLHAAKNDFKDLAYVNYITLKNARSNGFDCGYKKGALPVTTFRQKYKDGKAVGEFAEQWYNIEQIENPEVLRDFCNQMIGVQKEELTKENEDISKKLDTISDDAEKLDLTKKLHNNEKKLKVLDKDRTVENNTVLTFPPIDNNPESYMGAILATISIGGTLEVDAEQAKSLANKMILEIKNELLGPKGNPMPQAAKYQNFIQKANDNCLAKIKIMRDENSMQKSQQKIENKISRQSKEKKEPEMGMGR